MLYFLILCYNIIRIHESLRPLPCLAPARRRQNGRSPAVSHSAAHLRAAFQKGGTDLHFRFLGKYVIQTVITLTGISFIMFAITMLGTEDLARQIITGAEDAVVSQEQIDAVTRELGLDQPFFVQFGHWMLNAVQGDLGFSYMARKPVVDKILESLPATLSLAALSLFLMTLLSLPLGILSAYHRNRLPDFLIRGMTFFGISIPSFWLGLMLLWFFGLKLGLFPIVSSTIRWDTVFLPALTLAISMTAKYTRQVRSAVLEELGQDYVMGARARGMSELRILLREVLPNALLPLVTLYGLSIGSLLGGAAVVEIVFGWQGLGLLAVKAIEYRDIRLLQGIVVWIAGMYMLINMLVDLSYSLLDPRLRRKEVSHG